MFQFMMSSFPTRQKIAEAFQAVALHDLQALERCLESEEKLSDWTQPWLALNQKSYTDRLLFAAVRVKDLNIIRWLTTYYPDCVFESIESITEERVELEEQWDFSSQPKESYSIFSQALLTLDETLIFHLVDHINKQINQPSEWDHCSTLYETTHFYVQEYAKLSERGRAVLRSVMNKILEYPETHIHGQFKSPIQMVINARNIDLLKLFVSSGKDVYEDFTKFRTVFQENILQPLSLAIRKYHQAKIIYDQEKNNTHKEKLKSECKKFYRDVDSYKNMASILLEHATQIASIEQSSESLETLLWLLREVPNKITSLYINSTPVIIKSLSKLLTSPRNQITQLSLSQLPLTLEQVKNLKDILIHPNCRVENLIFSVDLSSEKEESISILQEFFILLKDSRCRITTLDMSGYMIYDLKDFLIMQLKKVLEMPYCSIKHLNLSSNNIDDADINQLYEGFRRLESIDLSTNLITAEGMKPLSSLIADAGASLKYLNLCYNNINNPGIALLMDTLFTWENCLHALRISNNRYDMSTYHTTVMPLICRFIQSEQCKLTELELNCDLPEYLEYALLKNNTIFNLRLIPLNTVLIRDEKLELPLQNHLHQNKARFLRMADALIMWRNNGEENEMLGEAYQFQDTLQALLTGHNRMNPKDPHLDLIEISPLAQSFKEGIEAFRRRQQATGFVRREDALNFCDIVTQTTSDYARC